jgi:hypothetical protein
MWDPALAGLRGKCGSGSPDKQMTKRFCRRVGRLLSVLVAGTVVGSSFSRTQSTVFAQELGGRTILVSVADSRAKSLVDLEADDFVVNDGGRERDVVDVHIADYPVVLLLDAGVEAAFWPTIKSAAQRFITRIGERPVIIGSLSDPAQLSGSFDDDRASVLARLAELPHDPSANHSTLPTVAKSARLLRETSIPFSAIVVITARPIDSADVADAELLPSIVESGSTVHIIENRTDAAASATADLLKVLADQTHGQYTLIFSSASYAIAMDRLADKLAAEMMVQYVLPNTTAGGEVKVGVRRPGARVVAVGVAK